MCIRDSPGHLAAGAQLGAAVADPTFGVAPVQGADVAIEEALEGAVDPDHCLLYTSRCV